MSSKGDSSNRNKKKKDSERTKTKDSVQTEENRPKKGDKAKQSRTSLRHKLSRICAQMKCVRVGIEKSPKQNKITTKNGIEKAKDKSKNKESKRRRRISRMGSVKSESVSEPSSQWRRLRRGFRASVCCFVRCSFTETLTHTLQSNVLSDGVDGADDRPRLHKRKKERNTLKH